MQVKVKYWLSMWTKPWNHVARCTILTNWISFPLPTRYFRNPFWAKSSPSIHWTRQFSGLLKIQQQDGVSLALFSKLGGGFKISYFSYKKSPTKTWRSKTLWQMTNAQLSLTASMLWGLAGIGLLSFTVEIEILDLVEQGKQYLKTLVLTFATSKAPRWGKNKEQPLIGQTSLQKKHDQTKK